jgi:hypothetical protein
VHTRLPELNRGRVSRSESKGGDGFVSFSLGVAPFFLQVYSLLSKMLTFDINQHENANTTK